MFPGIGEIVAGTPSKTLDVILVHGMCTHNKEWAEASIGSLDKLLGGSGSPRLYVEQVPDTQITLYRGELAVAVGTVRVTAMVWSPILATLKRQLCYDQTNRSETCACAGKASPPYPYKRASLNQALKDQLLNDCLADAIAYQGKSRDSISQQFQSAIVWASTSAAARASLRSVRRAAASESTPLVFVTESLGSKVLFDAIYKMVSSSDSEIERAGVRTFDRAVQIFMGANQIPILALADQALDGTRTLRLSGSEYPPDPLEALAERNKSRAHRVPRIVAFTDPNDLLSYILVPSRTAESYDVVDVVVSNDVTILGFVERPDTAHTGYRKNKTVMEFIACGSSRRTCSKD